MQLCNSNLRTLLCVVLSLIVNVWGFSVVVDLWYAMSVFFCFVFIVYIQKCMVVSVLCLCCICCLYYLEVGLRCVWFCVCIYICVMSPYSQTSAAKGVQKRTPTQPPAPPPQTTPPTHQFKNMRIEDTHTIKTSGEHTCTPNVCTCMYAV